MTEHTEREYFVRAERNCTAFVKFLNETCKIQDLDSNELTKTLGRIWSETK